MSKKSVLEYILLSVILILSFVLRTYKIDNPIGDWHSWRQADTSSVSRNFVKNGVDILRPRFDDLSRLPSGLENPQGYRMVEFPVYNLIQAEAANLFPQKPIEWWGRMISIIFSLGSIFFIFLITRMYAGSRVGLLSAFFFGVLPFNIYFSRVILPEPMMIFTSLGAIYFFGKWINGGRVSFIVYLLSLFFAAVTLLLKPFGAFLFLPMVYLSVQKWQLNIFKKPLLYLYLFLAVLPFGLWRFWISQYPEGIPNFIWLFNQAGIRFKGAFFRWIFAERLGRLILGYWGVVLLVLGIINKSKKKEGWFFYSWLLGVLLYFVVVASGNVTHDYYQVLAIPIFSIFLAKGADLMLSSDFFNKTLSWIMLTVIVLFSLSFSWYEIKGNFSINHPEIIEAGKEVDRLVPQSAKVIAPYNGDTAFLYQTNRQGWPLVTDSVDYLISRGATHYVSVSFDVETKSLMEKYKILKLADNFVILDLSSTK